MVQIRVAAALSIVLVFQAKIASGGGQTCSWTDPRSGSHWDLTKLVARQHYQFRGLIGAHDSLHTSTSYTGYHYEDYTYFLNLCRPVSGLGFSECHGKPSAGVYQIERGNTPHCFALGSTDSIKWGLSSADDPEKGVTLTYEGGEMCHKRMEKQVEKTTEPPPPPPAKCEAKQVQGKNVAEEAELACGAHLADGGGGKDACDADERCSYVPPPVPEKPSTYTDTEVTWVDVPRKVTINITCDRTKREDLASIMREAGQVVATEPDMCEYVVEWPSMAGCPGVAVEGKVQVGNMLNSRPSVLPSVLIWCLRLTTLIGAVILYREESRAQFVALLPSALRRYLRGGIEISLLPSSSPRKQL